MLVDVHTNLLWYPDHYSDEFVEYSWAAKKAKMRLSPDVHCGVDDAGYKHNFDSRPEQLLEAAKACDKVVVFAIQAPFTGIRGSQEAVADFVRRMWVLGGYSPGRGSRNAVGYTADGVNWYEVPDTPWRPRHAASVFVHDNAL